MPTDVIRAFDTHDISRLHRILEEFTERARLRCAALVDRGGQMVSVVGGDTLGDAASFASLTAADFAASDRLAELVGEREFASVYHLGELGSMYSVAIGGYAILAALFDERSTLGLVRLHARDCRPRLGTLFGEIAARQSTAYGAPAELLGADWASEAEHEIDRLFGN